MPPLRSRCSKEPGGHFAKHEDNLRPPHRRLQPLAAIRPPFSVGALELLAAPLRRPQPSVKRKWPAWRGSAAATPRRSTKEKTGMGVRRRSAVHSFDKGFRKIWPHWSCYSAETSHIGEGTAVDIDGSTNAANIITNKRKATSLER